MESGKQCSTCNEVNSDEANFCMSCGANLADTKSSVVCSTCNEVNSDEANFCISCGAHLSDTKNIITVYLGESPDNPRVIELKRKLFSGSSITIEDSYWLYDAVMNDPEKEEVYKAMWKYLVGKKLCPELNVEKNWETEIVENYTNLIGRLIGDYISEDGIEDSFVIDAINSSENLDALHIIRHADFDWWSSFLEVEFGYNFISNRKLKEIIILANKRYSKIKKKWWQ